MDLRENEFLISDPESPWYGRSLHDLYQEAATPWSWHEPIMRRCRERELLCFSTPFDGQAVDFLESLQVPAYKIAYDEAYDFQEALVAQLEAEGAQQVGYKLGLTGPKRPFGAEEALYGRLLDFMVLENGAQVPAGDFVKPLGEWEIAYFFDKDVSYPVTVEELQDAVGQIAPAVELPDLVFADMKSLTWLDLIASDIAPRRVVIGDKDSDEDVDENAVTVVATMDGEVVGEGVGSAVMGDQWEALRFLAEKLNERGEQIHAGDFVISGAMNPLTPLGPGSYTVAYGPFGVITFEISE